MTKFQRKLNKLKKDLRVFFGDMYLKHKERVRKYVPVKHDGKSKFTIVSAIYNVEKYLDEFFESIVRQSLNFKNHIQIICVDDGSKDNSAEIIKRWQKKYPNNIHYYYKENGGQGSARNLGLSYVETEWVTFIDPDDFLSNNYFEMLDKAIEKDSTLGALVTNLIFYIENKKILRDNHPLRYRFDGKSSKYSIKDLKNNINLSASSTVFKTAIIVSNKILFDDRIKPNFEDGKFIADYFLFASEDHKIQFIKESKYFYRKREDGTSTLDKSWQKEEKYYDVLKYGFLPMLEEYSEKYNGKVPVHIQRTALYDMAWYVGYLLNSPEKTAFLSEDKKEKFQNLLEEIFTYIDSQTILEFNLAGFWWFQKVGVLGFFKKEQPEKQIVYIESIDREKQNILLSYFTSFDCVDSIKIDGKDVSPIYTKSIINTFNERLFAYEKRYWVSYAGVNSDANLEVVIDGRPSRISLKNKNHMRCSIKAILEAFKPSAKYISDNSWLLMDRETQADDNAEHFYRYMQKNHPEQQCYFAIKKESKDWTRLLEDGFNLVDFDSKDFEVKIRKASKIISSHIEAHINNHFGDNYDFSKKFIFLQHGVTKNDLSRWLNTKKLLNCFITATHPETKSIADGNYKCGAQAVALTGFPRHDALLLKAKPVEKKTILIMPTWRNNIVGESIGKSPNTREINSKFMETNYAQAWFNFLHNELLRNISNDVDIIFAPHSNITPYIEEFKIPKYIKIWDSSSSMQDLFVRASLLVTDYSSVAFELAYINKPVLYYQFDHDEIFSGSHTYRKGYYSDEEDGFGPVSYNEKDVFQELSKLVENNFEVAEPYKSRIQKTFPFRDGKNSERVYQAIINLDKPEEKTIDVSILEERIQKAYKSQSWSLLEDRLEELEKIKGALSNSIYQEIQLSTFLNSNNFSNLKEELGNTALPNEEKIQWQANIAYAESNWEEARKYYEQSLHLAQANQFKLLKCYAMVGDEERTEALATRLQHNELSSSQVLMIDLLRGMSQENWKDIVERQVQLADLTTEDRVIYQPELIFARAYRKLGMYDEAHQQLVSFEKHTRDSINCRVEIANLAFAKGNYEKTISQLQKAFSEDVFSMPIKEFEYYAASLAKREKKNDFINVLNQGLIAYPNSHVLKMLFIDFEFENGKWEKVIELVNALSDDEKGKFIFQNLKSHLMLGRFDDMKNIYRKPTYEDGQKYWELIAEYALIAEDRDLEIFCYKGMIAMFEKDKEKNRSYLSSLLNR